MRALVNHISDNRWLYVRLVPLLLVLFCPGPAADVDFATIPVLPVVVSIVAIAVALFFWITLGPDDGGRYSLKELFLFAPLLPISRSTCAIWTYLGVLVLAMTVSSMLWSSHMPLPVLFMNLGFGTGILCATMIAHSRLTRRWS